ncbi:hypothetical protein LRP88_04489 [Fusarium phalaenopsidis]
MPFGNPGPAAILASQWTLIVVATAVIAARIYLRLKIQNRRMLYSDIIMCTAWVFAIITAAFGPVFASKGALDPDVHTSLEGYKGGVEDLKLVLQLFFAVNFPFYTTFYLCKAALLAVYLQVFPEFMVKRRIFLWVTIVFVVIAYIVTITLIFTICLPLERNWEISVQKSCPGSSYAILFQVGWGLHFLGDLLVRFIAIQRAGEDYSISLSTIVLWSSLDVNVGLVIACLPSLRPYFGSLGSSGYPTENTQTESTTAGRQSEVGVKMHDPRPMGHFEDAPMSAGPSLRDPSLTCTEEIWDEGKRDNASDVELIQMHLPPR